MRQEDFEQILLGNLVGDFTLAGIDSPQNTLALRRQVKKIAKKVAKNLPVYQLAGHLYCHGLAGIDLGKAQGATSMAMTGAKAGSMIVPGIGTAIGAAVGAVIGLVGGQKPRYESEFWDGYKGEAGKHRGIEYEPKFINTAFTGLFRLGKNTYPGRQKYGPKDDEKFLSDMYKQIYEAARAGRISKSSSAQDVFNTVVNPWLLTQGPWMPPGDWTRWMQQITIDMIDNYISGAPSTWSEAQGSSAKVPFPKYVEAFPAPPPVAVPTPTNISQAQNAASSAVSNQALPITASAGNTSSVTPAQATAAITANAISQQVSAGPVTDATVDAIKALAAQITQSGMQTPAPTVISVPGAVSQPQTVATAGAGSGFDIKTMWPFLALGAGALLLMRRR